MLKSIQKNLSKLSNEELISLNHMVVDMLKSNRRSESFQKGLSLRPGQELIILNIEVKSLLLRKLTELDVKW